MSKPPAPVHLLIVLLTLAWCASASAVTLGPTELISVSSGTSGGNDASFPLGEEGAREAITPDGRYIAFVNQSSNLTSTTDANGTFDVFWRDLQTGQTKLVSVDAAGDAAGNNTSMWPSISDDGRYVVFSSGANNLVTGFTGSTTQVYLRDMQTGTTSLVSRTTSSATAGGNGVSSFPLISGDGHVVVWVGRPSDVESPDVVSGTITRDQIYARDLQTGVTSIVTIGSDGASVGNGNFTGNAILTPNGRYVAFASGSSNLVSGETNPYNGITEVYWRDLQTGTTKLVSADSSSPTMETNGTNGIFQPGISDDGRYVAFDGNGLTMISPFTDHDGLGGYDIFLRDTTTDTTSLVSGTSSSSTGNGFSDQPRMTGDGRYVLFKTTASDLVPGDTNGNADLVRWDRTTGTMAIASAPDGSTTPEAGGTGVQDQIGSISSDGNYVGFVTDATNVVPGLTATGTNAYLRDMTAQTTQLLSAVPNSTSAGGNDSTDTVWLSANGTRATWGSYATDLIASFGDLNTSGKEDTFTRAINPPAPTPSGGGGGGGGGGSDSTTPPPASDPGSSPPPADTTTPPTTSDPKPQPPRKAGKCKKGKHRVHGKCVKKKHKKHKKHAKHHH